ncbi:MAG: hypothetical protein ACI4T9_10825, partial [Prevotella sp.]
MVYGTTFCHQCAGEVNTKLWNGEFHALEQSIPRFGTVNTTLWNRQYQTLEQRPCTRQRKMAQPISLIDWAIVVYQCNLSLPLDEGREKTLWDLYALPWLATAAALAAMAAA